MTSVQGPVTSAASCSTDKLQDESQETTMFVRDREIARPAQPVSVTVRLNMQVLVAHALVALQVTEVVPGENVLPLGGAQPTSAPLATIGFG